MLVKTAILALASLTVAAQALASSRADICTNAGKDAVMSYYFKDSLTPIVSSKYERQFRDQTISVYPSPEAIESATVSSLPARMQIHGTSTQAGIYPGAYRFDVLNEGGVAVIEVRVQVKDARADEIQSVKYLVQKAEDRWNREKPSWASQYKFRFVVTDDEKTAHFHVKTKLRTRGPYFKNWDPYYWTETNYAHEIGHMMGLVDEYEVMSSHVNCDPTSLWCDDSLGYYGIKPFHYYMILRKVAMTANGCGRH